MITAGRAIAEEACSARLALGCSKNAVGADVARQASVGCSVNIILLDVVPIWAKHLPFCFETTCVASFALFRRFASPWTIRIHRTLNFLPSCLLTTIIAARTSYHDC